MNARALVVLLRGVNVGGHRTFRPSELTKKLAHLDVVNIGAAGTFVVRKPMARAKLRSEFADRLPFDAEIVMCSGREILELMSCRHFEGEPKGPDFVPFVSVCAKRPKAGPFIPLTLPSSGTWLIKILARDDPFVFGMYRRHIKAIGYLGTLDRLFGVPVTTRNWTTMNAIASVLAKV